MNWITNFVRPKIQKLVRPKEVPDNLWHQCPKCNEMVFHRELEKNLRVCTHCGHLMRMAARDRLRPILMTTLTTILGLLPLAFGQNSVGDVLYFPLARTVIGGLAASTVLTLLLVPCLYTLLEDGAAMVGRVWRGGARAA